MQTKQSRIKKIVLKDLFRFYPYKTNIPHPIGTVPNPYIKAVDIVDHKYTMDYNQWSNCVEKYLDILKEELSNGNEVSIPNRLGTLQIKKVKLKRFFNRIKSTQDKKVYTYRTDTENYFLDFIWYRKSRESMIKLKWYWSVSPVRSFIRSIYEYCENNYTHIYNFSDK